MLDAFHITVLGMKALDEVRHRVQQTASDRRSHKDDPRCEVRRLLRRRADRLTADTLARLTAGLTTGDRTTSSLPPGGPPNNSASHTP